MNPLSNQSGSPPIKAGTIAVAGAPGVQTPGRPLGLIGEMFAHHQVISAFSIIFGLSIWQLAAGFVSDLILPTPLSVLERFTDPVWLSRLLIALSGSLTQLVIGFGLSLGIAVPLGLMVGRSITLTRMFEPLITALYAIPPVAFVPFLIIWFGLFVEARVALVFLMTFFDILVIVIAGARDIRRPLIDVGRSFGASYGQRFRLILLPSFLPFFFAALRVGSARAINGMITAELFFAAVNLGAIMKHASQNFDSATALSVVLLICFLGLIAQSAINMLERHVLHWHVRSV